MGEEFLKDEVNCHTQWNLAICTFRPRVRMVSNGEEEKETLRDFRREKTSFDFKEPLNLVTTAHVALVSHCTRA